MSGQALKGHLDLLVLAVIEDGPKHGYAVIEALRERSEEAFELPEGTVYPALHRLEKAGLLQSEWSEVQGRRRRTYRLTPSGTSGLAERKRSWEQFSHAMMAVVEQRPWPTTT